jgi:hypothetical protein
MRNIVMKRLFELLCILLLTIVGTHAGDAADEFTPLDIAFKRQAVGRFTFDESSAIPLSGFTPNQVVNLKTEYPQIPITTESCRYIIDGSLLRVTSENTAESALWMGGFNPFATFDVSFAESQKQSGTAGVEFATPDNQNRVSVVACFDAGQCRSLQWSVLVNGKQLEEKSTNLKQPTRGPFTLRVQVLGTGLNVFIVRNGRNEVVNTHDFSKLIDLRQKKHIQSFEFRLLTQLNAGQEVVINQVNAALTTGVGQADICALTYEDGSPLLDNGRLWFTMSVRGRHLPHPLQGVFSLNPSVFDVRLESIIVFDRDDGLLRNEIASHIFYDRNAEQWRGLTVGFSAEGDPQKIEPKQLWAVSSQRDPRFGFTIMKAAKVDMPGGEEDPHIIYDTSVQKWRVLVCTKGGPGYPATLYEADHWNGPFKQIAGPVDINSTGCLLQKFGDQYYALFGGKGGQFHVYSYPELNALGALDMERPPWSEGENSRCWPNVIPLPEGYPAPYIALSMDRANYPGLKGWTYGALYLYHGHVRQHTQTNQE